MKSSLYKSFTCAILAFISWPVISFSQDTKTHVSSDKAFSITYPENWKVNKDRRFEFSVYQPGSGLISPSIVNIEINKKSEGYENADIHQIADAELQTMKTSQNTNIEILDSKFQEQNGHEWWILHGKLTALGKEYLTETYKTIHNGKVYVFSYSSNEKNYEKNKAAADEIIASVNFLTENNTPNSEKDNVEVAGKTLAPSAEQKLPVINKSKPAADKASANSTSTSNTTPLKFRDTEGTIAKDAKTIEADEALPFYKGYAPIRRGQLWAVINANGEIILPYAEYNFLKPAIETADDFEADYNDESSFFMFIKRTASASHDSTGFIRRDGKIVYVDNIAYYLSPFDKKGTAYILGYDNMIYSVDSNGIKKPIRKFFQGITLETYEADKYSITAGKDNPIPWGKNKDSRGIDQICGYYDFKSRKLTIPLQFESVNRFYEGLAAVKTKDKFGDYRWGFINTKGEWVIAPEYRKEPSRFANGVSVVDKNDGSGKSYINKKNEQIFFISKDSFLVRGGGVSSDGPFNHFYGGYIIYRMFGKGRRDVIIDTTGKIYAPEELYKKLGVPLFGAYSKLIANDIRDRKIYALSGLQGYNNVVQPNLVLDLTDGSWEHLPAWSNANLISDLYFDRVSGLRYFASKPPFVDLPEGEVLRGYINKTGEFVIIVKKPD